MTRGIDFVRACVLAAVDASFKENEHPRDKDGKFAGGSERPVGGGLTGQMVHGVSSRPIPPDSKFPGMSQAHLEHHERWLKETLERGTYTSKKGGKFSQETVDHFKAELEKVETELKLRAEFKPTPEAFPHYFKKS